MIIKIVIIAITGAIFANYFKTVKPEYALIIGLACAVIVMGAIIVKLSEFIEYFNEICGYFDEEQELINILVKLLGISYISELAAGICRDAGFSSVAFSVVIFGKITIMLMGSTVLFSLLKLINSMLG